MTAKPKTITPKQLIKALESGKYRKAKGQLQGGNGGYCCLGVACKEAGVEFVKTDGYINDTGRPEWAPWLIWDIQNDLVKINDDTTGWSLVIAYLKTIKP